jgi:hypothetical protein
MHLGMKGGYHINLRRDGASYSQIKGGRMRYCRYSVELKRRTSSVRFHRYRIRRDTFHGHVV